MGCSSSLYTSADKNLHGIGTNGIRATENAQNISEEEKRFIKKTWKVVCNDMPGVGARIFLTIFSLNPGVKQIFKCRDATGDELLRDKHFRGHASRFMQAVGAAVDNINDLDNAMAPLLFGLGQQHIHYKGFKVEYFDIFTVAILKVFASELDGKYTDAVADAWRTVVEYIIQKLKEGYTEAIQKQALMNEHPQDTAKIIK